MTHLRTLGADPTPSWPAAAHVVGAAGNVGDLVEPTEARKRLGAASGSLA